jgi:hypothetical protein
MILSAISRRRLAGAPVLVALAHGESPNAAAERIDGARSLVSTFDLAPLMRRWTPGWRDFRYATRRIPGLTPRTLRISAFTDASGDDVVLLKGGPAGLTASIRFEAVGDMTWGMMTPGQVLRTAGLLAATALGCLRSAAPGAGLVSMADAEDASRLASLHHAAAGSGDPDPMLDALGAASDQELPAVWGLRIDHERIVLRPVAVRADAAQVGAVDAMRMVAAAERIRDAWRDTRNA